MKRLLVALVWLGCSSAPTNPTPKTNQTPTTQLKPVTESKPATEATSKTASQPAATQGAALAAPATTKAIDAKALAQGMLNDRNVVAYSSSLKTIILVETYIQEGTGAGMNIVVLGEDGKQQEEIEVHAPGDDEEAKVKATIPTLEKKLSEGKFEPLARTDWPKGKEMVTPFEGLELQWKANELTLTRSGEGKNAQKKKIPKEKPFTITPTEVHTLPSSPVVVIQLDHDPGSAYGEGFNVFSSFEILPMPQVPSH
jgi:hypothetical protein